MDLEDGNMYGAMQCSIESFKFLFNIQKRKSLRSDESDYICIINTNQSKIKNTKELSDLFRNSLRKGDVFTFWNQNQVLLMLHDVQGDGIKKIENRIYNNLKTYTKLNRNDVNMTFQSLMAEKTLL